MSSHFPLVCGYFPLKNAKDIPIPSSSVCRFDELQLTHRVRNCFFSLLTNEVEAEGSALFTLTILERGF